MLENKFLVVPDVAEEKSQKTNTGRKMYEHATSYCVAFNHGLFGLTRDMVLLNSIFSLYL